MNPCCKFLPSLNSNNREVNFSEISDLIFAESMLKVMNVNVPSHVCTSHNSSNEGEIEIFFTKKKKDLKQQKRDVFALERVT